MKKFQRVSAENVELISTVEAMGTWEGVRRCKSGDYNIWEFNGILYQIPPHEKNANWNETRERDTYMCNIITPLGNMQVKFWDSINNTINNENRRDIGLCRKSPSNYDILACLQKYDVGELEDFIFEFGYTIEKKGDLKRIKNIYDAVVKEYNDICRCFTPEQIEKLQEIA